MPVADVAADNGWSGAVWLGGLGLSLSLGFGFLMARPSLPGTIQKRLRSEGRYVKQLRSGWNPVTGGRVFPRGMFDYELSAGDQVRLTHTSAEGVREYVGTLPMLRPPTAKFVAVGLLLGPVAIGAGFLLGYGLSSGPMRGGWGLMGGCIGYVLLVLGLRVRRRHGGPASNIGEGTRG
jgi:hypothetical protein